MAKAVYLALPFCARGGLPTGLNGGRTRETRRGGVVLRPCVESSLADAAAHVGAANAHSSKLRCSQADGSHPDSPQRGH
jgi:hypothetical protein